MTTYSLYHDTGPNTRTDDPKVAIAHGKAKGCRLTLPGVRGIKPLPRLTLPPLKDQPAEKVYQELAKSIAKHQDSSASHIGKTDEEGYWLAETDGYRALMRAGNGTERARFPAKTARQFTPGPVRFVLNRPFAEVWRRMSILADNWIDLELTTDTLILSTRDKAGDTATEVYPFGACDCSPAVGIAEPVTFRLNPTYLAPLLRFWPITVAYRAPVEGDAPPPLVFSPAGAGWRYILMSETHDVAGANPRHEQEIKP